MFSILLTAHCGKVRVKNTPLKTECWRLKCGLGGKTDQDLGNGEKPDPEQALLQRVTAVPGQGINGAEKKKEAQAGLDQLIKNGDLEQKMI